MAEVSAIGTRHDMRVRLGATLRPQVINVSMASLAAIDPLNSELVAVLYANEADRVPLADPGLVVEELAQTIPGTGRYLITCPRDRILALNELAQPLKGKTPPGGVRALWWACFFEDAEGARSTLFFGRLSIYQGAVGG